MKLVVVDVGNTSTAVGLWVDGRVSRVSHVDGGFKDASGAFSKILRTGVDAMAYVSVVPEADGAWRDFAAANSVSFRPLTWKCAAKTISIDYPKPATIGADRLADAVGAVVKYGAPVIIMDFGTALTAAAVTRDRVWRGGAIAPGFPLMRDYLFERTAKLPRMSLGKGKAPKIGRSTAGAMKFGALVGYCGMVREIAARLSRNFNEKFKLVATGGYARWALSDTDMDFTIDPDLTLFGAGTAIASAMS